MREMQEMGVLSLGQVDPLEEEMTTLSSTLAWKIPWTKEPGGLQSMGSQGRTRLSDFTFKLLIIINKGLPWWLSSKGSACQCRRLRFNPWVWVWKIP